MVGRRSRRTPKKTMSLIGLQSSTRCCHPSQRIGVHLLRTKEDHWQSQTSRLTGLRETEDGYWLYQQSQCPKRLKIPLVQRRGFALGDTEYRHLTGSVALQLSNLISTKPAFSSSIYSSASPRKAKGTCLYPTIQIINQQRFIEVDWDGGREWVTIDELILRARCIAG